MKHRWPTLTASVVALMLCRAPAGGPAKAGEKKSGAKKVELPHPFYWAVPDPVRGDWQGKGGYVAQVVRLDDKLLSVPDSLPDPAEYGKYQANLFRAFDVPKDRPVAVLQGAKVGDRIAFTGDGWSGQIEGGRFRVWKGGESMDLEHVARTPPTLGAKPPAGAVVLFDGTSLDAWAKMKEKEWLVEDGPPKWNLFGGVMEAVPHAGSLISRRRFGDARIHLEFCTLGGPTNSGLYIQNRYEVNINEMYGRLDGNPCGGLDNCTPSSANPGIRCSRPPLEWQTLDVEFRAPRFDDTGKKVKSARATVRLNGTLLYKDQELGPVRLNAARLGEAATGPLQLQEHGMPVQFRNIWVLEEERKH